MKTIHTLFIAAATLLPLAGANETAPRTNTPSLNSAATAGTREIHLSSFFKEGFGCCIRREITLVMVEPRQSNGPRKGVHYPCFMIEEEGRTLSVEATPELVTLLQKRFREAGGTRLRIEVLGYESVENDGVPDTTTLREQDCPPTISARGWHLRHVFVLLALSQPSQPALWSW